MRKGFLCFLLFFIPLTSVFAKEFVHPITFAEFLDFADSIESENFEEAYSIEELSQIHLFIAQTALHGAIDEADLPELIDDINELLLVDALPSGYAYQYGEREEFILTPHLLTEDERTFSTFSVHKTVKKAKKFVKKHKKIFIVGGVVIVAGTAIAISLSTGGTAAPILASAAGALLPQTPEQKPFDPIKTFEKTPIIKETITEKVTYTGTEKLSANDPSFSDLAKEFGSMVAHESLDAIADIVSAIPQTQDEIESIVSAPTTQRTEEFEEKVQEGHKRIDEVFDTNRSSQIRPEMTIGILPPPIHSLLKNKTVPIKRVTPLDKSLTKNFQTLVKEPAISRSIEQREIVREVLKPYKGKYLPEAEAKKLLHSIGIRTYPRPKGIPDNYRVKLSDKGGGIKYVHPKDSGTYIRVMPGNPQSENPAQRAPYVNQRYKGKSINKMGEEVGNGVVEAHIPYENYEYIDGKIK